MQKPNILVTGSKGQLGNELNKIKELYNDYSYIFTDVDELDITNLEELKDFFSKNRLDFVINCAAYTAVDKAETDIENAYKVNSLAVKNLMECCKLKNIPIIHGSTDYVFDGTNFKPIKEDQTTNPQTVYGASKLEGEKIISQYDKAIIIRTSWLYSVYGNNFVKTIIKLSTANKFVNVVFDQVGTPTNAADLADAILKIVSQTLKSGVVKNGIYNYSNEGVCSWYDFAKAILENTHINSSILPVKTEEFPRPAKRPYYSVLDKSKIKSAFDLEIPYWKDSLEIMLKNLVQMPK